MVDQLKESLPGMFRQSPPWFALLVVVGGFLAYLDRQEGRVIDREKRAESLSSLRIDTCHQVQTEATRAISELNKVMKEQSNALYKLQLSIENLNQ